MGIIACLWSLLFFSACSPTDRQRVDELNSLSYAYHYRNLDSTEACASRAYAMSARYGSGRAEALNNLAFVSMARMDYDGARRRLDEASAATDNQVELLVSDVLQMRLCQRMSRNRDFYDYCERAKSRLSRIAEERDGLSERMERRMIYAETEFAIVNSAYYYYVGLEEKSAEALAAIDPDGPIRRDTAQYLNYLYNIGSGGILTGATPAEVCRREFGALLECFFMASRHGYGFFEANSLGAMAGQLIVPENAGMLLDENARTLALFLPDSVAAGAAAGWMAYRSLEMFEDYGDVYQTAGARRTLASCFMASGDYGLALTSLEEALVDTAVAQAPDLVASIREQLSVVFSALDDKPASDYNRNIYIDLQEQTRQDRYLESRAGMLDRASSQLNVMIVAVLVAILVLVAVLFLFRYLNRRQRSDGAMDELLRPLREWQEADRRHSEAVADRMEEINEAYALSMTRIRQGERRSMENRAKVSLACSVVPLIDRIINEVTILSSRDEAVGVRSERYAYISELASKINELNDILTHWIQMRQGRIDLHIESFALQPLFDIVAKGKAGFRLNGVELDVQPTGATVKADRVLTLFMINTLADNARKFTPSGGRVTVSARQTDNYVEVAVEDTGCGLTEDELARIFEHKIYDGHGFGLMNCRGIIDRYRKMSRIFSVCQLSAESCKGAGSRFFFRLPRAVMRSLVFLMVAAGAARVSAAAPEAAVSPLSEPSVTVSRAHTTVPEGNLPRAKAYADSAYFSNIAGTYERTLAFADSCRMYLNRHYLTLRPGGRLLMTAGGDAASVPPEILWFRDSLPTHYNIILDMRNESAVAALALHRWQLYTYNNKVYTQLFKELSADNTLAEYCRVMQQSQTDKTIAVILLVLLLVIIPPAYYLLYYRHRLYFRFCVERIRMLNDILLSDDTPSEKLRRIEPLTHEQYPAGLQAVVDSILGALRDAVSAHRRQSAVIELAADECRRAEYEEGILHITNSVLDNCLSTLKHETMYYPSRIARLADSADTDLKSMEELAAYYRAIHSILTEQAMRQTERVRLHVTSVPVAALTGGEDTGLCVLGDRNLLEYLFEILRRTAGRPLSGITVEPQSDRYLTFTVPMPRQDAIRSETQDPFVPSVDTIPYLLCRQIVRDHSDATHRYGCGIRAVGWDARDDSSGELADGYNIKITLPHAAARHIPQSDAVG